MNEERDGEKKRERQKERQRERERESGTKRKGKKCSVKMGLNASPKIIDPGQPGHFAQPD